LADGTLKHSLQSILKEAKNRADNWDEALANARQGVEKWFDEYMDRVSGWYKRNTQLIILILALFIASVGNVDTIAIGRTLWVDTTLREAVANQATTFVVPAEEPEEVEVDEEEAAESEPGETKPVDESDEGMSGTDNETEETISEEEAAEIDQTPTVAELQDQLRNLGLPIGWYALNDGQNTLLDSFVTELPIDGLDDEAKVKAAEKRLEELAVQGQTFSGVGNRWPLKVAGIIMTALAVSLGAPFWFDLLGKLVNMRSTGKPEGEASKHRNDLKQAT
jgi:hypothetical protein